MQLEIGVESPKERESSASIDRLRVNMPTSTTSSPSVHWDMLVCPLCRLTLSDTETDCPRDGHEGIEARAAEVPASLRARFAVVEPFAQGGSGDTFLADDQQTGRRGLLKLLRLPANMAASERARLKRELVKQATLANPNLSVPLATGDANGVTWVFREWYEGVSLRVKLARGGALAVPEALAIASQIAAALDELHRSGLLHRDLKPGHVILNPQPSGVPKVTVIDAGIAARIETDKVFDVMGTAEYVSPEQARGKLVSFRSDLYALGCLVFEMLTGTTPFAGPPATVLSLHAEKAAPTPQVTLPTGVSTLLSQLLAKEPRERPFSAQQVRRALEPFLPEDANSKREATQTFEALSEKRRAPKAGTGTLRPGKVKATEVSMAVKAPALSGANAGEIVVVDRPERKDATMELSETDLGTPVPTNGAKAGDATTQPTADPAPAEVSVGRLRIKTLIGIPEAPGHEEPAAAHVREEPPTQRELSAQPHRTTDPGVGPASQPPPGDPMAQEQPFVAPAAPAFTAPRAAHRDDEPVKLPGTSLFTILALVAVVGICFVGTLGSAAIYWLTTSSDEPIATNTQPQIFQPPLPSESGVPVPETPPEPTAPEPIAPAPPTEPVAVQQPALPPVPVAPIPTRTEPAPPAEARTPRGERPPRGEQPASTEGQTDRFSQAREEALAHFQARRFEQAAEAYEQATQINPRHAGSFAGLGAARLALGQHDAAVRAYERAIALSPNHAGFQAALGRAHLAAGDREQARQAFRRALAIDPNNQAARQGLQTVGG